MEKLIIAITAFCIGLTSVASFAEGAMGPKELAHHKMQVKKNKAKKEAKQAHEDMKKEAMPKEEKAK